MRLNTRERAIAIATAEACIREARAGTPQLLGAEHHASHEMSEATEERLRSLGGTTEQIETMKRILKSRPPRPAWHVRFLLHDPRYADGITVATVKIDDVSGATMLEVLKRGDPSTVA